MNYAQMLHDPQQPTDRVGRWAGGDVGGWAGDHDDGDNEDDHHEHEDHDDGDNEDDHHEHDDHDDGDNEDDDHEK